MDSPFDLVFNGVTGILAPIVVLMFSICLLRRAPLGINLCASLLFAASAFVFFSVGSLFWALRDGLAPGFVPSTGTVAVRRFAQSFSSLALLAMLLFIAGICVIRRKT